MDEMSQSALNQDVQTVLQEVFPSLDATCVERLGVIAECRAVSAGTTISTPDTGLEGLMLLMSGSLDVLFEGTRVRQFTPPTYFGEGTLVRTTIPPVTIIASTDARIAVFDVAAMQDYFAEHPRDAAVFYRITLAESMRRIDATNALVSENRQLAESLSRMNAEVLSAQHELQNTMNSLEERVRARTTELENSKVEAEAASRAKSDFLSSMSHELRTPLNAILGFGQVLEMDPAHPLADSQSEAVDQILGAGRHLLDLINEVLDFAKLEAGRLQMSLTNTAPGPLIAECLKISVLGAKKHRVTLEEFTQALDLPEIRVEPTRFKQVLLNLLSNAIKYNRPDGSVTVKTMTEHDEGVLRLEVWDTGNGIPADKLDELFQPFNRLGREGGSVEGTGIGLTITKRLIEMMGGSIGCSSTVGTGSTFWITMPLARREEAVSETTRAAPLGGSDANFGGRKHGVLILDPDPSVRVISAKVFNRLPQFSLYSSGNIGAARQLLDAREIGILILNLDVAETDPEILDLSRKRMVRVGPSRLAPKIIGYGAEVGDWSSLRAKGVDLILPKPLDFDFLLESLEEQTDIPIPQRRRHGGRRRFEEDDKPAVLQPPPEKTAELKAALGRAIAGHRRVVVPSSDLSTPDLPAPDLPAADRDAPRPSK